jgi:DNA (cytosine-5)-methyltransferase 1
VAGGPPCQGFSIAGRRDEGDERNKLVDSYLKFVDLVQPESVLFENVKGFTMGFKNETEPEYEKKYSEYIVDALIKRGYDVSHNIVDFTQFGIPQTRNRFILFASKEHDSKQFFDLLLEKRESFLRSKKLNLTVSIEEAISDLTSEFGMVQCPDSKSFNSGLYGRSRTKYQRYCRSNVKKSHIPDSHRFTKHKISTVNRYNELHGLNKAGVNLSSELMDTYGVKKNCITVLDASRSSPTLTSHPDDYIHYKEPRILTVREYARIQSFPDWFVFKGKYTTGGKLRKSDVPRYTQIANAIPPLFAEQVGLTLSKIIQTKQ